MNAEAIKLLAGQFARAHVRTFQDGDWWIVEMFGVRVSKHRTYSFAGTQNRRLSEGMAVANIRNAVEKMLTEEVGE